MKSEVKGDTLLLIPSVDFTAENADDILDFLKKSLSDENEAKTVSLDAQNIESIDSIGINLLVGLHKQASSEGRQLQIINPGEKFSKIIDIIRLQGLQNSDSEETTA